MIKIKARENHTVWSVVYNLDTGQIQLALGKDYENVHSFEPEMSK